MIPHHATFVRGGRAHGVDADAGYCYLGYSLIPSDPAVYSLGLPARDFSKIFVLFMPSRRRLLINLKASLVLLSTVGVSTLTSILRYL